MIEIRHCSSSIKLIAPRLNNVFCRGHQTAQKPKSIRIPQRIERGPTDILRALANTVKNDPTANHYKFPDDPYFYVNSNVSRRLAALSLESGRKSARWIVENSPELFNDTIAQPQIQAFQSKFYSKETPSVSDLVSAIHNRDVADAIELYEKLNENGEEVSKETKQMLLELTCFYNSQNPSEDERYMESAWYQKIENRRTFKTWDDNGFAEKLYGTMGEGCPRATAALILGRLKYGQITKAADLFNDAREKGMDLPVRVYNSVLANVMNIVDTGRWDYTLELLREMDRKRLQPNIDTLHAVLESIGPGIDFPLRWKTMCQTLREFVDMGVRPTPGTYYYFISAFFSDKRPLRMFQQGRDLLREIIADLSSRPHQTAGKVDLLFFSKAMHVCWKSLEDLHLASSLNQLLEMNDNRRFLYGTIEEFKYYKFYIYLKIAMDSPEAATKFYNSVVPSVYMPDLNAIQDLLQIVSETGAYNFMGTLWDTVQKQSWEFQKNASQYFLKVVPEKGVKVDEGVGQVFLNAADTICDFVTGDMQAGKNVRLEHGVVSDLVLTYIRFGVVDRALKVAQVVYNSGKNWILTDPVVQELFDLCMTNPTEENLLVCLKAAQESGYSSMAEMAERALPHMKENKDWTRELMKSQKRRPRAQEADSDASFE